MFHHRIYGLQVLSSIPIDGLLPAEPSAPDCELDIGPVEMLPPGDAIAVDTSPLIEEGDPGTRIERSRTEPGTFVFEFLDGMRFRIEENGRRVIAHFSTSTAEDMATYFVGPVLAFMVRLRGDLALHAGAVVLDGAALLITGVAGAGKSTTTAAFLARGASLVTDDVAVIHWNSNMPHVFPGHPRVRLWDDSAAALYGSADALPLLTPTWSKRFVDASRAFAGESVPIRGIAVLAPRHAGPARARRLTGHEAAMALLVRSPMTRFLDPAQRERELDEVTRLAERVPIIAVTPRNDLSTTGELVDAIAVAIAAAIL